MVRGNFPIPTLIRLLDEVKPGRLFGGFLFFFGQAAWTSAVRINWRTLHGVCTCIPRRPVYHDFRHSKGSFGNPMLQKFLLLPVILWLLLPPGICICHGFGSLLPLFAAELGNSDNGPICEDTEEPPWCPYHKMTYHSDSGSPPSHQLDFGLVGILPAVVPIGWPIGSAVCLAAPPALPADSPLYLNLCALLI